MKVKAQLMDEPALSRALMRISHEIVEKNKGAENLLLVGIRRRGEHIARRIRDNIQRIEGVLVPCGSVDIRWYRDDLSTLSELPQLRKAELGYDVMLLNRTQEKAAGFALSRQEYGFAVCPAQELKNAVKSCDLIIYAASGAAQELTSLQAEDFVAIPGHRGKIVIEANYKEPSFKASLLYKIALAGATYVPGQNWLLLQALAGYSTLTGALPKIF